MKTPIEVESRKEAKLIGSGLKHRDARTVVKVMGALSSLPTHQAKIQTMELMANIFSVDIADLNRINS